MKRITSTLLYLLPLGLSPEVIAKPLTLQYSEVALRYEMFSTKVPNTPQYLNGHGAYIAISYDAFKNIALNMEYGSGMADTVYGNNRLDLKIDHAASIGASYHRPIYFDTDLLIGASILRGKTTLKANTVSATADKNGYGINVGIRSLVARHLELNAALDQTRIEGDSTTQLTLGGAYYVTNQTSAGLHYSVDKDSHSTVFSLSIYY